MSAAETADALVADLNASGMLHLRDAEMQGHSLQIVRVASETELGAGESVQPGEAIRLLAAGISSSGVAFEVHDAAGALVFAGQAGRLPFRGAVWIDTRAPFAPGAYTARARATSGFNPFAHWVEARLDVRQDAPPPRQPPAGGDPLGALKTLAIIGVVGIGLVTLGPSLGKLAGGLGKGSANG